VTRVLERTEGFRQLLGNILTVNAALVAQRQNDKLTRLSEAGYDQNEQVKRISSWAAILFAHRDRVHLWDELHAHPRARMAAGLPLRDPCSCCCSASASTQSSNAAAGSERASGPGRLCSCDGQ
jgi:hypothetical protein